MNKTVTDTAVVITEHLPAFQGEATFCSACTGYHPQGWCKEEHQLADKKKKMQKKMKTMHLKVIQHTIYMCLLC